MCFVLLFLAVLPKMTVQEHAGNEKSSVWHATDFADGELKEELFCIRFASIESECNLFDPLDLFVINSCNELAVRCCHIQCTLGTFYYICFM